MSGPICLPLHRATPATASRADEAKRHNHRIGWHDKFTAFHRTGRRRPWASGSPRRVRRKRIRKRDLAHSAQAPPAGR